MKKNIIAFLQLIPVVISALLMAAHFLYAGNMVLVIISLAFPLILFVRRRFSARVLQIALLLATIEWGRTVFAIASIRMENDFPWGRLAIILGSVACFTFLSGLVFFSKTLKERYTSNCRSQNSVPGTPYGE